MRRQARKNPEITQMLDERAMPRVSEEAASEGYIRGEAGEETARREEADADRDLTGEQADDTFESRESSSSNKINRWRNISDADMPRAVVLFIKEKIPAAYQESVRSAFTDEIRVTVLEEDTIVYRYYGGTSASLSYWFTPKLLSDPIRELALPPTNTALSVMQYLIPKGTIILGGRVAPLFDQPGGGYQYYLPDPSVAIRMG